MCNDEYQRSALSMHLMSSTLNMSKLMSPTFSRICFVHRCTHLYLLLCHFTNSIVIVTITIMIACAKYENYICMLCCKHIRKLKTTIKHTLLTNIVSAAKSISAQTHKYVCKYSCNQSKRTKERKQ